MFSLTVVMEQQAQAQAFVEAAFASARCTYSLAGSIKYELSASEVSLSDVFRAVERARGEMTVLDFGISNMSLEEVTAAWLHGCIILYFLLPFSPLRISAVYSAHESRFFSSLSSITLCTQIQVFIKVSKEADLAAGVERELS